jgi:hypothetical protein
VGAIDGERPGRIRDQTDFDRFCTGQAGGRRFGGCFRCCFCGSFGGLFRGRLGWRGLCDGRRLRRRGSAGARIKARVTSANANVRKTFIFSPLLNSLR